MDKIFDWETVFTPKQQQEINRFLVKQMKECNKDICLMEYALIKMLNDAAYDYELEMTK